MKILVFDCETTGLPIDYKGSIYNSDNWPFIVQLSFILFDCEKLKVLTKKDLIIKVDNIPPSSTTIHGITQEYSNEHGILIKDALDEFNKLAKKANRLVAHNLQFDKKMIIVESIRNKQASVFLEKRNEYCTMKTSVQLCKIERQFKDGTKYFKYPTLTELHMHLFNKEPTGQHNALYDILICLRCYFYKEYKIDLLNHLEIMKKII